MNTRGRKFRQKKKYPKNVVCPLKLVAMMVTMVAMGDDGSDDWY